jgi:hypothetical protein
MSKYKNSNCTDMTLFALGYKWKGNVYWTQYGDQFEIDGVQLHGVYEPNDTDYHSLPVVLDVDPDYLDYEVIEDEIGQEMTWDDGHDE